MSVPHVKTLCSKGVTRLVGDRGTHSRGVRARARLTRMGSYSIRARELRVRMRSYGEGFCPPVPQHVGRKQYGKGFSAWGTGRGQGDRGTGSQNR